MAIGVLNLKPGDPVVIFDVDGEQVGAGTLGSPPVTEEKGRNVYHFADGSSVIMDDAHEIGFHDGRRLRVTLL